MSARAAFAFIFFTLTANAFAGVYSKPVVMTSVNQMGDTAELRFDAAPAHTGTLVILGDRTKTPQKSYPFVYSVPDKQPAGAAPTVDVTFGDKQTLNITCDPLADNCQSAGYVTEGGSTFSILWKISRH
ncbi:hypothetical protein FAZ69_28650 [Trinickia terrae]|uniref:H-type lectin domain-containing protein n=1 Tax=Trinickia terrae TaxID=2571161 RepID=A0A4U1HMC6_9BURK|nr:hypothetical protein [Trinickia terrae]TKC81303.1 hypothetical protein FAZ69_28650 [Trinickia terrae]